MSAEKKLQRLLVGANGELERWEEAVSRALALLSSLANLTTQREACERCRGEAPGGLGVLASGYPLAAPLLLARLVLATERCLAALRRERDQMHEVVQRLKRFAKEARNALKDTVAVSGLEASATRTVEGFSLQDHTLWLDELHWGLRSLLGGISAAMETLEYTSEGVAKLREAWQSQHKGLDDIHDNLRYTVAKIS